MIATPALDKVLKFHARHCGVHVYSGDRECTCGRDAAIRELQEIKDAIEPEFCRRYGVLMRVIARGDWPGPEDGDRPCLIGLAE